MTCQSLISDLSDVESPSVATARMHLLRRFSRYGPGKLAVHADGPCVCTYGKLKPRFHRLRRALRHRKDRRPCTTAAAPSGTSHNPPTLAPAYTAASLPQTCARTAAVGTRVTGTAKSAVSSAKSAAAARQRLAAGCRTVACGGRAASLAHQADGRGIWR